MTEYTTEEIEALVSTLMERIMHRIDADAHLMARTALALRQLLQERAWKPIIGEMRHGGPWLVTNNPSARNNLGSMTHIWVTDFVQHDKQHDEFICFDGGRKVMGLKLYLPILPPAPETKEIV